MRKIQLMHPGRQKPFMLGNGYIRVGNHIIRQWNNGNTHYRKFIAHNGYFVNDIKDPEPTRAELYFWGEWEGNSFFSPFSNFNNNNISRLPNGLHRLFHSTKIRGKQNTDPYIYGDDFKYCFCNQKGQMTNLDSDDLILFGTVMRSLDIFYIDTVFIIKGSILLATVQNTNSLYFYSQIYREETLQQLNACSTTCSSNNNNQRLYHSKTWWDDKKYFSFVPCKSSDNNNISFVPCKLSDNNNTGFERLYIPLDDPTFQLSKNTQGISYLTNCQLSPQELWEKIVERCHQQGFKLGVKFDEPVFCTILNNIPNISTAKQTQNTSKKGCS